MPEGIPAYLKEMQIVLTSGLLAEAQKQTLTLEQLINKMKLSGMSIAEIKSVLLTDLTEGGQIFGDFRKQFKATVKGGLEDTARGAVKNIIGDDVELWDWLGITDGKICPVCLKRHNMEPMKYEKWQTIGLPGSGVTLCGKNCRCVLVPAGAIQKDDGGFKR